MIIMYPLTVQFDYTELRFSLRSIQQYCKGVKDVIVVGDHVPDWLNNVTVINLGDVPNQPQLSVRRKVIAAFQYCKQNELFYLNDDFFLLRETDPLNFPYYSTGLLSKTGESGAKPLTKRLQELKKPIRYYGHYPALYGKDFAEVLSKFPNECITKSCYLNFIEVENVEVSDCKLQKQTRPEVIKEFIKGRPCFSTGVFSLKSAIPVLEELYPEPSVYEI